MWNKVKEFFNLSNGDLICALVSIRNDSLTTALFLGIIGGLLGLFNADVDYVYYALYFSILFFAVYLFWVVVLLLIAIFHKEARGKNWRTTQHLYWKYDWYKKIMPGEIKDKLDK